MSSTLVYDAAVETFLLGWPTVRWRLTACVGFSPFRLTHKCREKPKHFRDEGFYSLSITVSTKTWRVLSAAQQLFFPPPSLLIHFPPWKPVTIGSDCTQLNSTDCGHCALCFYNQKKRTCVCTGILFNIGRLSYSGNELWVVDWQPVQIKEIVILANPNRDWAANYMMDSFSP